MHVRVIIGVVASVVAGAMVLSAYADNPRFTADFGQWHLAARTVLNGDDPYMTNGPGMKYPWPWPFMYPATVICLVMPFAWFPENIGAMVFVAISTFVMVMAITRRSLHLLVLLVSLPFQSSAVLGQWSLLLTAAVFYPALGFLAVVKPQAGLPVVAATRDRRGLMFAAGISAVLLIASFVLLPRWPAEWLRILSLSSNNERYLPPLLSVGGMFLPLALLRWRRREAWLLLGMSVLPQSLSFYFLLPLFTIPRNFGESVALAVISTAGIFTGALLKPEQMPLMDFFRFSSNVAVLSVYLPCLLLLLIRENQGVENPPLLPSIQKRLLKYT